MNTAEHGASPGRNVIGLARLLGTLLLIILTGMILTRYSIKAFSDPYNYLTYAQDITEHFWTSRWPVLYPAFLWLALKLVGPYYVFLANLPILLILVSLLGVTTWIMMRVTEQPATATTAAVGAMALLLGFAPDLFLYLTNPYRDPLSHVLMLSGAICMLDFLTRSRPGLYPVAASGLLIGLSASVREPSILMAIPLGLAALMSRRKDKSRRVIPAAVFAAGLVLGLMPLLVQMYAVSRQVLLPPQAIHEGTALPGFRPHMFVENLTRAYHYYKNTAGPMFPVAVAAGVALAAVRRNRFLLFTALPAVILYTLLYSFYRAFFERYFFIVTIWTAPLAAYGLYSALVLALDRLGRPRSARLGCVLLTCLLVGWAAFRMITVAPASPRFQIPDARLFTIEMNALVPPGAFVVCPRNMCEVISFFTHAESEQATALLRDDPRTDQKIKTHYRSMLADGRPVFLMTFESQAHNNEDQHLLLRYFDLDFIASLPTEKFALQGIAGPGTMTLYRVHPWKAASKAYALTNAQAGSILRLDTGQLWHNDAPRTQAILFADDRMLSDALVSGVQYFRLPESASTVEIRSDSPVSSSLPPEIFGPGEPIEMDFGILSRASHDRFLSQSILDQPVIHPSTRVVRGEGSIRIPTPWPPDTLIVGKLFVRGGRSKGTGPVQLVIITSHGTPEAHLVDDSSRFRPISFFIPRSPNATSLIHLNVAEEDELIEMDRLLLYPQLPARSFVIDVGSEGDDVFALNGFHKREMYNGRVPVRWTTERARLSLNLAAPASSVKLGITYRRVPRPASAPPEDVQLIFNGNVLPQETYRRREDGDAIHLETLVPGNMVNEGANHLTIATPVWRPRDHGVSADGRALGILLDRVDATCQDDPAAPP